MNPRAPRVHGIVKLHKQHRSIRPIVNSEGSPGYKLTKYQGTKQYITTAQHLQYPKF
jgi:hypothetical protein